MPDIRERERNDLVLMPRQFAYAKDMTKGNLVVYVGPFRTSLSETDQLIIMDEISSLLRDAEQREAIRPYINVAEGEYVVLVNPAKEDRNSNPEPKKSNDIVELQMGRRVNLPGPLSFPLWPFQTVKVIGGHQLQLNQFVVVRVINDAEAIKNWAKAIIKPATEPEPGEDAGASESTGPERQDQQPKSPAIGQPAEQVQVKPITRPDTLSVGQLLIIKGTEVSFYIPPTGLEVVPDDTGKYVREAETLEQLEYCVLVDQSGEKRFVQGPSVVFPKPSEQFVKEGDKRKFRAIELTEISGIHIKVTSPYDEGGKKYKAGDELFITGKDQPIYFPRAEHAIVKYEGRGAVHFATAVPKGEGRYVLNRSTGEVGLVKGPKMLLPDPRNAVLVRRILSPKQVELWYPDNEEAVRVNVELARVARERGTQDYLAETDTSRSAFSSSTTRVPAQRLVGEELERGSSYTQPRTVTLNTKFDGAVQVDVWTGYAALVVDKTGKRQVVEGPQTILLEFDQSLASMELSMGKPKTTDRLLSTSFLRVLNNRVSDIISAETADMVQISVTVSYRVNFEGNKEKWFDAENYVKLLCDHGRSLIRNMVKKHGIEEFSADYIDLLRDTILGTKESQEKKRAGLAFAENGMRVYDVEVLKLDIGNPQIAGLLVNAQHRAVQDTLELAQSRRKLDISKEQEEITRQLAVITTETALKRLELDGKKAEAEFGLATKRLENEALVASEQLKTTQEKEKVTDVAHDAELAREKRSSDQELEMKEAEIGLEIKKLMAESKELAQRTKAVTPDLIAALERFGSAELVEKMAKAMAPMALLGGESVADILSKLLKGTGLEGLITSAASTLAARSLTPGNTEHARS